jgi:CubicO group peptidase (beta-lactamase class C family)
MMLARKNLLVILGMLVFLTACTPLTLPEATPTATRQLPTVTQTLTATETLQPATPTAALPVVTPTAIHLALTPPPTQTLINTTAPYDKVPEQMDDGWETASLADVGIDPAWITKMLESIYTGEQSEETFTLPGVGSKYLGIHNILIVKDGRLVFEEYFYFQSPYSSHEVASVTKSFTSLLVGLAIEHGYLESLDEKILTFFPEYLPLQGADEQVEKITIEDLLTMRHGWECDDWDPASRTYYDNDHPLDRSDLVETILYFPMESSPGASFSYCTSGTYVLNALLTKVTGMELSSFGDQYLFEPLGIESVSWIPFLGGWPEIGGVQSMRPRDMAKIGLLVLQNGNWNGEQIISEDWIRLSTQEHVSLDPDQQPSWGEGYGYLWWLGDVRIIGSSVRSVCALGGWQQVIAIFPKLDLVVVINGGDHEDYEGQAFQIMERFILPAVLGY